MYSALKLGLKGLLNVRALIFEPGAFSINSLLDSVTRQLAGLSLEEYQGGVIKATLGREEIRERKPLPRAYLCSA
jgi:hypothetical protein